ncbi:transposable element Tcb1 transposase [Trichonephila clavipes]|nr:transposable element Tcb1 transposase [Trichonephila clavipes]
MGQRSREKEQKHQYINETENVLMRACTPTNVSKCMNFLQVHIKSLLYETPFPSKEGNTQTPVAAERIRDMPGIFQNVRNSMQHSCQEYKHRSYLLSVRLYAVIWFRVVSVPPYTTHRFVNQEQLSGGSVVVVHEEPHPQMTGTLSYRPEETGGRQRDKSLDTRHRRLDDRYRVLPWPEDCTVVVCLHDALYDESRFSLSSDSHRILIWRERGSRTHPSNIIERDRGAMGLRFLFMDDNAQCHRTIAAEQLLESEDIERMDWAARSPDLNPIEHVWDFLGRRLAARTLPPVTIRELRLALQDEWAAMPQRLIDTLILSMGRRCETCLAVRGDHIPY